MNRRPREESDEAGVVLVMMTICLVVLLGVAALVVDLGLAHVQQRKQQNAADASALGGIQDLFFGRGALNGACTGTAVQKATCDGRIIGDENASGPVLNWTTCTDTQALANLAPGTQCISFGPGFTTMRVRIPNQSMKTLFAGAIGATSLTSSKAAVAGILHVGPGGVRPFTMLGGFDSGAFCLDNGGNGNSIYPCDGPNTGNFGVLDFTSCGTPSYAFKDTVAAGSNHLYGLQLTQGVNRIADDCSAPDPNVIATETGNVAGQEREGLIDPGPMADGGPGLLRRYPSNLNAFSPNWETTTDGLDNRPIWEFIPSTTLPDIPDSCQRATFDNLLSTTSGNTVAIRAATLTWGIDRCFFEYRCGKTDTTTGFLDPNYLNAAIRYDCNLARGGAGIAQCNGAQCRGSVFGADTNSGAVSGIQVNDIVESPRFIHVPQMWQTTQPNGNSGTYDVKAFRAVYVQRLGGNNGPYFEPGPWNTSSGLNNQLANVTGFVFPAPIAGCTPSPTDSCGTMLPGSIGSQPFSLGENATIHLIK
jgi:hypothetical protein